MADARHEIVLKGCAPEPLMNYLKALGILRLLAEDRGHGDSSARGFWRDDMFVLRSKLDEAGIVEFFLKDYRPTPLVVPWSGGDFLAVNWKPSVSRHKKTPTASAMIESVLATSSARLQPYRDVLVSCQHAMASCGLETNHTTNKDKLKQRKKDFEKIKWTFIETFRATCPGDALEWIDAAAVTGTEAFAPLLGSGGGSDGNTHFSDNFMQNLWDVLPEFDQQRDDRAPRDAAACRAGLRTALFAESSIFRVEKRTSSLFDSGAVGGPNATQGMERDSLSNPWDVILGFEGTLCFAAAVVKRLTRDTSAVAAFPFQVSASPTLRDGLAEKESSGREVWLPLWHRPSTIGEIRSLLGEGRAQAGERPARNGVDMARAIGTLGVDRGLASFHRYAIVKGRVGGDNYNTAVSLGRIAVTEHPNAYLLLEPEFDDWLNGPKGLRRACSGENVPARFGAALRAVDAAIFDFCRYGATHFQSILIALGAAERGLASAERFRAEKNLKPLTGLSSGWIEAAGSARSPDHEFEIALALAGIRHEPDRHELLKYGPIRANLEPVNWQQRCRSWADRGRAVVWNAADLSTNLAAVLARRVMDGERTGCENLPLAAASNRSSARPAAIESFLRGDLDERRIEDLIWGLMLVDSREFGMTAGSADGDDAASLPFIYCLFKLLFLPRDLVAATDGQDKPRWRLARTAEDGTHRIRPEARVLSLLRSDRVGEAAAIAMRRLWVSGLALWCSHTHHTRDCQIMRRLWASGKLFEHDASTPVEGRRLAAALLIPVPDRCVGPIVQRVTKLENWVDAIS